VIFHHAQGLTPGVRSFGDRLAAAGHTAHAPDLYEGRTAELEEATFFAYPGERHLFADDVLPSYDADAATQAEARVLELLARI